MKKENIVCRQLENSVQLDDEIITEIYFDLLHINYGWNKDLCDYNAGKPRSNYTEEDIVLFFEQLNYLTREPKAQTTNLKSVKKRYLFYVFDEGKKLKMVVDYMKNSKTIVVTLYEGA